MKCEAREQNPCCKLLPEHAFLLGVCESLFFFLFSFLSFPRRLLSGSINHRFVTKKLALVQQMLADYIHDAASILFHAALHSTRRKLVEN
jgi:hypothetical protein